MDSSNTSLRDEMLVSLLLMLSGMFFSSVGIMSLQVGLLTKSGLWSFSVMNESLDADHILIICIYLKWCLISINYFMIVRKSS